MHASNLTRIGQLLPMYVWGMLIVVHNLLPELIIERLMFPLDWLREVLTMSGSSLGGLSLNSRVWPRFRYSRSSPYGSQTGLKNNESANGKWCE